MLGADHIVATQMHVAEGKYTGEIGRYAYGPEKAVAILALAEERGYDLAGSYAYSDSATDVPMLEAVGHPVAVNPEVPLHRLARSRRWPVEIWEPGKGTPKVLVPPVPEDFTW